ncbi:MAG: cysteine--tRNA ligase [Pseudomonadota bacterium]
MSLQFYNTLSRKKESFKAIDDRNVRMYVCGPTVYDFAHIGNARPVVVFDVLFRLLRHVYGKDHVTYARNITDVEDKINTRAAEEGTTIKELTERTTEAFHDDMAALGALPPSVEPRATDHIGQMIAMMEALIDKGHAYAAEGHVLFSVPSMETYGTLSGRNRDEMIAGARVEVAPYKNDPADFVLWKPSSDDQPGWDSPWGRGRPGWHIECSAMSEEHLGPTFDIHGGGLDLVFPHHENEIAQSHCANGLNSFARVWMHNGYVVVNGEKMSKSLGNFFTVRQLLDEGHRGEAIRLALLSGHYRAPLDITREKLKECKGQLDRLYGALRKGEVVNASGPPPAKVVDALSDDLNTPLAITHFHELAGAINKAQDERDIQAAKADLMAAGQVLGLLGSDPEAWFKQAAAGPSDADIQSLIDQRLAARKAKNFAEADRIRDNLKDQGVVLEDGPGGTTWRRE